MRKNKLKFIPAAVIILLAASAMLFSGCSKEEVYRLIKVNSFEGEVSVQREEKMSAFEGMQLVSEDSVEVGNASFLELLADSDKHIGAEENTAFTVHSTGTEESGSITIDLLYGKALVTIDNKLNESSTFDVKTPNATLSVRGTCFSVEYNRESGETTVEVFEGTVWAVHSGKTDVIEKDGVVVIGNEDTDSPQTVTSATTASAFDEMPVIIDEPENDAPVFTIGRQFADSADYRTAPPKKLDIYLYGISDDQSTAITAETDMNKLSSLEKSIADIDSRFIEPIIVRANLIYDEKKTELAEAFYKDEPYKSTDITEWYSDFTDRNIVVSDEASVLRFEFTRVTLDWIYAEYPPDIEHPILEPGYIDSDGRRYYIVGMAFTFFGNMNNGEEGAVSLTGETPVSATSETEAIVTSVAENSGETLTAVSTAAETTKTTTKATEKTTKKTTAKTTEAISEAEESGTATAAITKAEENTASMNSFLFSLSWWYNNVENYASAPAHSILYLYQEEFPLETTLTGYCDDTSGAAPAEPLNKAVYDLFCDYLEPLREKINKYFEENKNKAVEKFKSGADYDWTDVTDWFPETITITGENGTYICNISTAMITVGRCNATGDSMENHYFISDKYIDGDNYVYAGAVDFSFYGYIE